jgi:muramoyltetrapeptide carboxypeptidase
VTSDCGFPILKTNDFGHKCPNTVLPVGVTARLDADKKEVEILEKYVSE